MVEMPPGDRYAVKTSGGRGSNWWSHVTPTALEGLSPAILAAFERDYAASRHRRPKCSREDFAAGYVTCLEAHWLKGRKRRPPEPPEGLTNAG